MSVAAIRAELAVDARCTLGESVVWCARSGRLYWVDIEGARLWRHDPRDGATRKWAMPERLATFALCESLDWLLLGLASRLAFFNLDTGELRDVVPVEPGHGTRVNDGRCDRNGRFVFGTKDEREPLSARGGFYRLNRDLQLERLPLPAPAIANGIAFSPDGATLYYCDSPTREIRACAYGADGAIADDRVFARLADADGEPDGAAVDAAGGLWSAQWGVARVVRYGADGRETERVHVPTPQPSCVAFGGADLQQLFVTSARVGLDAAQLAADPRAGGIYTAGAGRLGLSEPWFAGTPPGGF